MNKRRWSLLIPDSEKRAEEYSELIEREDEHDV